MSGWSDEELFEQLGAATRDEGVPAEVVAAAKAALTWRTIDAELAALTFDTLDEPVAAGVRGEARVRALSFETGGAVIDVEVERAGALRRLEGQVVPADVAALELHRVDEPQAVPLVTDDLGRFRAEGVRPGRLRLLCRFRPEAGGATLLTEWVLI